MSVTEVILGCKQDFLIDDGDACANYVNLAISQSLNRLREIDVRKVMGQKRQSLSQFKRKVWPPRRILHGLAFKLYERP